MRDRIPTFDRRGDRSGVAGRRGPVGVSPGSGWGAAWLPVTQPGDESPSPEAAGD